MLTKSRIDNPESHLFSKESCLGVIHPIEVVRSGRCGGSDIPACDENPRVFGTVECRTCDGRNIGVLEPFAAI